jgi:hypothetical protein
MLFSHRYTLPPSFVGVASSAHKRAVAVATFWLAVVKVGSYYSMAQLASNADSYGSTSASRASMTAHSLVSLLSCHIVLHLMSSRRAHHSPS